MAKPMPVAFLVPAAVMCTTLSLMSASGPPAIAWRGLSTASQRQRPSHSELIRLAIERLRRAHDARTVAAMVNDTSPPTGGEYGSYALTEDQIRWLREVKGHAFLAGVSISQADGTRAAVEELVGLTWRDRVNDRAAAETTPPHLDELTSLDPAPPRRPCRRAILDR